MTLFITYAKSRGVNRWVSREGSFPIPYGQDVYCREVAEAELRRVSELPFPVELTSDVKRPFSF